MSNNFKPSATMMKSQENKDGHAPLFSHWDRNSQRIVHPHFWWWFWRVLRHHPTLYKDTPPKKQTWNPKIADLQMFLQRWVNFQVLFSGSIYVCFRGVCSSIRWKHQCHLRHTRHTNPSDTHNPHALVQLLLRSLGSGSSASSAHHGGCFCLNPMVLLNRLLQEEKNNIKKLQEAPKKRLHITEVPNQKIGLKGLNC